MKTEMKQAGEAVPKRTFAVVTKKQNHGSAPCVMAGWPWPMVMPQVPHRWHTDQVRGPGDFHLCFTSQNIYFGLFNLFFSFCLDNINPS